jgi:DNA-binding MarR family transcriptional regulator
VRGDQERPVTPAQARADLAAPSLAQLLGQVEHRVSSRVAAALGPDGPSVDQWRVLSLLADGAGHPMSEIAAHAMVPAPTLTKIVDRLVDAALVYRRVDEADRRRVLVFLSDRGRGTHERLGVEVARAEQAVIEELDAGDAEQLLDLLSRLADRLR